MSTTTAPAAAPASPSLAHGLTDAELAHFHACGWVVKRALVDADLIKRVEHEIEGLHDYMAKVTGDGGWEASPEGAHVSWEDLADGKRRIRQLMNSEKVSPLLNAISHSEAVLSIMRQVIGPDVLLFHSKLMMKSARDGSFTPWHQDFQYWQYEAKEPTQVNCMLYVDKSDFENGGLRFVDGSHKGGMIPEKRFAGRSFNIGIEGGLDAFPDATLVDMEPGDAVFFGPFVIHGSGPNESDRHRRANTFAFDKPGNRLKGDEMPIERWRCGKRWE